MMRAAKLAAAAAALIIAAASAHAQVIAGWDFNSLSGGTNNFGPSPYAATTLASGFSTSGLVRGLGVLTTGSGAARALGGNDWVTPDLANAVAAGDYFSFTISHASSEFSLSSINPFGYRRSGTGPGSGQVQFSLDGATFLNIGPTLNYASTLATGGTIGAIDLTQAAELQNIGAGATVTFRVVNWGGSGGAGTWYFFDVGNSTATDFAVNGAAVPEPAVYVLLGMGLLVCAQRFRASRKG